jgi:hypothetical protein
MNLAVVSTECTSFYVLSPDLTAAMLQAACDAERGEPVASNVAVKSHQILPLRFCGVDYQSN